MYNIHFNFTIKYNIENVNAIILMLLIYGNHLTYLNHLIKTENEKNKKIKYPFNSNNNNTLRRENIAIFCLFLFILFLIITN